MVPPNAYSGAGAVYVIFGTGSNLTDITLSTLNLSQGIIFKGASGDALGGSITKAGDINGDGVEDIAISATSSSAGSRTSNGAVYFIYGQSSPSSLLVDLSDLPLSQGFKVIGTSTNDGFGNNVAFLNDVDGDGNPNIISGSGNSGTSLYVLNPILLVPNCTNGYYWSAGQCVACSSNQYTIMSNLTCTSKINFITHYFNLIKTVLTGVLLV